MRAIGIRLPISVEMPQDTFVARIGLAGRLRAGVGIGLPVAGVVDDRLRDRLLHNALHHLENHLLPLAGKGVATVVGFQFVAQIPVGKQHHILVPEPPPVLRKQAAHIDIVVGNVVLRIGIRLRHLLLHASRHTGGEHIAHAGCRPLEARPTAAERVLLRQSIVREVEDSEKRHLVGEHVVAEMCHGAVSTHYPIGLARGSGVGQLRWLEQLHRQHIRRLVATLPDTRQLLQ